MNSLATLFKIEAAIRKASSQNWQVTCGYATSNSIYNISLSPFSHTILLYCVKYCILL